MKGLKVGDAWLSLSDLKSGKVPVGKSEHEDKAIKFCRSWLEGRQEFQFRTSGSTGTPKEIYFTRAQLEASASLTRRALNLQPGYTALVCLDVNFIAGAMMLVRGLTTGMNMIVKAPSSNPLEGVSDTLDFTACVPYQLITALEKSPEKLNQLKIVIIGGAPVSDDLVKSLQNLAPTFYATYGMTETITHVALQKLNGPDRQNFFQLLPGITGTTDDRGCLVLKASHLGQSVSTQDRVIFIDENKFRWTGREDQVINSGGVKVLPEKVEAVAAKVLHDAGIRARFFVGGIPDPKLGQLVVLVLEGSNLDSNTESTIKVSIAKELPRLEVPKALYYIPKFEETLTQKIDKLKSLQKLLSALQ